MIRYKMRISVAIILVVLVTVAVILRNHKPSSSQAEIIAERIGVPTVAVEKKKVLFVDSYHSGYEWSDGVINGALLTFGAELGIGDTVDNSNSKVELRIARMDTKRNASDVFKVQAALEVKQLIDTWQPNAVISSDDNAFKYVVMPYYRNAELPVVFCGLNWDASIYGAPYKNSTGMVEVAVTDQLIEYLKNYSSGNKIGYLSADIATERKNLNYYKEFFNFNFYKVYLVGTFKDWKEAFANLQDEVDIVIFENNAGILDWDDDEAARFVLDNIKIPVGTTNPWTMRCSVLGFSKIAEEQGEYAAKTVLQILNGESPANIPSVTNEKTKTYLNMKLAKKLGIKFPMELINQAEFVD